MTTLVSEKHRWRHVFGKAADISVLLTSLVLTHLGVNLTFFSRPSSVIVCTRHCNKEPALSFSLAASITKCNSTWRRVEQIPQAPHWKEMSFQEPGKTTQRCKEVVKEAQRSPFGGRNQSPFFSEVYGISHPSNQCPLWGQNSSWGLLCYIGGCVLRQLGCQSNMHVRQHMLLRKQHDDLLSFPMQYWAHKHAHSWPEIFPDRGRSHHAWWVLAGMCRTTHRTSAEDMEKAPLWAEVNKCEKWAMDERNKCDMTLRCSADLREDPSVAFKSVLPSSQRTCNIRIPAGLI